MTFEEEIVSIQDMAFFAIPACRTIGTISSKEILWDPAGKVLVVNHHRGKVRAGKGGLCSQVRGVLEAVAEKLSDIASALSLQRITRLPAALIVKS